jgi:2-amino-4-hydroxy-6-hydroxymethyldihydropteridine diphosphokinase
VNSADNTAEPRNRGTAQPKSPASVVIALGSNLGDREWMLRAAVDALRRVVRVVRLGGMIETEPVDAPAGSPRFLNMVAVGWTRLSPESLLDEMLAIERRLGRRRPAPRNAPRTIDLDLILHSANLRRSRRLTLPHLRYLQRPFVIGPLRELELRWRDPVTQTPL